jgi:U3 small nucleolar RNA-associated protein 10
MSILSESFVSSSDLTPEVTSFFLSALEFRSDSPELSNEILKLVEPPVISSLTCLVLKLSESAFRPLYYKLFDWAVRIEEHRERAITFYWLVYNIIL